MTDVIERALVALGFREHHLHATRRIGKVRLLKTIGLCREATSLSRRGKTNEAVNMARRFLDALPSDVWLPELANGAVDVFVNAGKYQEALSVPERFEPELVELARDDERRPDCALVDINRAEAAFNLGNVQQAHALLDAAEPLVTDNAFALGGLCCLRGFIQTHEGQFEQARQSLSQVQYDALTPLYAAEVHFSWAILERECGEPHEALKRTYQGRAVALRSSSERNGLFLLGSVLAALDDADKARQAFERAVRHKYRAQGADGLLRYARFLTESGEFHEAQRIRLLVKERDPESNSAREILG